MKLDRKRKVQAGLSFMLAFVILFSQIPVYADDIENLENKTSNLQSQLSSINQELLDISNQIASTETGIEAANNEMLRIQDSLSISRENETRQYEDMKTRIKYMYENGTSSLLELLFSAKNLTDFLNKADFIQNISEYDREKLTDLQNILSGIEQQEADLKAEQTSLTDLQKQLKDQQAALEAKAVETSTDLNAFNAQLQALRAEEARKAEESKKTAESGKTENGKTENQETSAPAETSPSSGTDSSQTDNSAEVPSQSGDYVYPSGDGVLTPEKGVVDFNGHRETYYSQKVLPGGGLNIPGRHVAEDGTIRDGDGYICVASSDLEWGTIVETSLGTGKVYDSGCASGTIDIYTDW